MTSPLSPRPVTALRARMIEDMTVCGFTEETRNDYVRRVRAFAAFIRRSPDTATAEDLRRFQLHQRQSGMQPPSVNNSVSALRFFFTVTLDRPDLARRLIRRQRSRARCRGERSAAFSKGAAPLRSSISLVAVWRAVTTSTPGTSWPAISRLRIRYPAAACEIGSGDTLVIPVDARAE